MSGRVLTALFLFTLATTATASPVHWVLTDVLFEDGGTATGSFIYDAHTDMYTAISITTTDDLLNPVATYTSVATSSAADAALVPGAVPDLSGEPLLQLIFEVPLTNTGGTVFLFDALFPADSSFEGSCLDATCSSTSFGRLMVDGGVTGTPVPLPGSALLIATAFALSGWRRRQRLV